MPCPSSLNLKENKELKTKHLSNPTDPSLILKFIKTKELLNWIKSTQVCPQRHRTCFAANYANQRSTSVLNIS